MSNYPEHDKMLAIKDKSQVIGQFLEWLESTAAICEWDDRRETFWQDYMPVEQRLAQYFDIDLKIIEKEKRQMLDDLRAQQR